MSDGPRTAECEQYAEGAASLAVTRRRWLQGYRFALRDLLRLDERLDAHLDGVLVSGEIGRAIVDRLVDAGEPGARFVRTVLSLVQGDRFVRDWTVDAGRGVPANQIEIDEALAWAPYRHVLAPVRHLLDSNDPEARRMALAALTAHRVSCDLAVEWIEDADVALACEALRHVATVRVSTHLYPRRHRPDSRELRYWMAWAGVLLGSAPALQELTSLASEPGEYANEARDFCLIALTVPRAHELLRDTTSEPQNLRRRIVGAALVGDPRYVSWLTDLMRIPTLARAAGEAFCAITGIDLVHAGLDGDPLDRDESIDDSPQIPLVENPDDGVLWPDAAKVSRWWAEHQSDFNHGQRYLCGRPLSVENCLRTLQAGYQRHRSLAALHLGLSRPDVPLCNVKAPAWRQHTELEQLHKG